TSTLSWPGFPHSGSIHSLADLRVLCCAGRKRDTTGRIVGEIFGLQPEDSAHQGDKLACGLVLRQRRGCQVSLASTSMSQAGRTWLLAALEPVFDLHVRLPSAGWQAQLPGVPGSAPAPTVPGWLSFLVVWVVDAGQPGAGSSLSRCQQARKAWFHGQ